MGGPLSPHLYPLLVKHCCDCYCLDRNWSERARGGSKTEHLWAGVKVPSGAALARGKRRGGRDTFTSKVHLHMQACNFQWVCAWHAPHLNHCGVWWGQVLVTQWGEHQGRTIVVNTSEGSTVPATAQDESSDSFPTTRPSDV